MTHPSEWPDLFKEYPIERYLQHSEWENNIYKLYYGNKCSIWPVGIDTEHWKPVPFNNKQIDILLYDKVMWDHDYYEHALIQPIREYLSKYNISYEEIRYGYYRENDFRSALSRCKAMIFLCEHESQGLAYQECLASGVPILAWDQGKFLDPNRYIWGESEISATSIPYFDPHCGIRFQDINDFEDKFESFIVDINNQAFSPRDYIMENLTLEKCSKSFVNILEEVNL